MDIFNEIAKVVFTLAAILGVVQCSRMSSQKNLPDTVFWGSYAIVFALFAIGQKL